MTEWVSGNNFFRSNQMAKAGQVVLGHTHNFDHTTIIFRGAVRITAKLPDGSTVGPVERRAPAHVLIRAGVEHEIVALEDETEFWCVYSHREPDGTVVPQFTGWEKAYF